MIYYEDDWSMGYHEFLFLLFFRIIFKEYFNSSAKSFCKYLQVDSTISEVLIKKNSYHQSAQGLVLALLTTNVFIHRW